MGDTCGLCHKLYSSPRLLQCLHVFDSHCISKYLLDIGSQVVRCPECKAENIVKENMASLPVYWPAIESVFILTDLYPYGHHVYFYTPI